MKLLLATFTFAFGCALFPGITAAQDAAAGGRSESALLESLSKKLDEQNSKLDALSQQMLKLEQQLSTVRPGVMIGESTPASSATVAPLPAPASGNSHVVAKGETLTSIAKAYKVNVQELQKFNHIENDRALQIGQTIAIPTPGGAASSPTPNQ